MYLLKILNAKTCGDLFTNNPVEAKIEYKAMVKEIHPDICKDERADEAMKKLNVLYEQATDCFASHTWKESNRVILTEKLGKSISIKYRAKTEFELGTRYVCDLAVCYVFKPEARRFAENAVKQIKSLRYKDDRMKQEIARFMPEIKIDAESTDGSRILVLGKTADVMPLDLVLKECGALIDARHAAWMISRLCNLSCYLSHRNLSHNGLTPFNLFVSPQYHSVVLLGGWWYTVPIGTKMIGTTKDIYKNMPTVTKSSKCGHQTTDFEAIKAIGRTLTQGKSVPDAMERWLNAGSPDSALELFKRWDKALDQAFGKREFIKLEIDPAQIYKE